jgi:hypothetical protein
MYITKSTFYTGKPGAIDVIPAGTKISAGDLGVDSQTIARYIKLGMLSPLLEPENSSRQPTSNKSLKKTAVAPKKSAVVKRSVKSSK